MASKFEERLNRSQANIENRIKQDFERLQKQVQKRLAKEKSAQEISRLCLEEVRTKAQESNKKAEEVL